MSLSVNDQLVKNLSSFSYYINSTVIYVQNIHFNIEKKEDA